MAATLTTLSDLLKVYYISGGNEQLNKKSILYNKFVKSKKLDVQGKSWTYNLHVGRNHTAGTGMSEGGSFPTAGNQGWKASIVSPKYLSSAIKLSGPTVRAAKGDPGAFANAVSSEVEGVMSDFIRSINRQLNGNGTGWLGYWMGADNTSGTTIDDSAGNAFIHLEADGSTYTLDLVDTDGSTLNGTAIVVTVGAENAASWDVTWSGTVASSGDADWLVYSGTLGTELMGIDGIISASDPPLASLQGLAVATYGYWKAQSEKNSGTNRDLSFELMQKPLTRIETRSAGSMSDIPFLLTNGGVYNKYIALCVADKRHVNSMTLDGGQKAVDFNGLPLVVDPQTKQNTIFYPNPKGMDLLTSSDGIALADFETGQEWHLGPGSSVHSDNYLSYSVFYGEFASKQRNSSGVLGDISI